GTLLHRLEKQGVVTHSEVGREYVYRACVTRDEVQQAAVQGMVGQLFDGELPALVATSSLELGIDMGAIDLVVQIESPPSVSAGMQRIGRAGHHVGAVSAGVIFPKFRGDLVSCTAVSLAMQSGAIEPSRYPRNPLDVLAQQIVAMTALDDWDVGTLFEAVRCSAPYAELRRGIFDGVLDLLSGVYPSDDFAELRPRINWDRLNGTITARKGAQRVVIANAGTIPDRGLYGVFLAGATGPSARVGELDEEMVFEASPGETFILGASTWRIEEITFDRVIVSPAPGQPGKMPFWHGESADRSVELGRSIGALLERIRSDRKRHTLAEISESAGLDLMAGENLFSYVEDQAGSGSEIPTDRRVVVERSQDELGDWRICVLSPWGGRVHAPWAMGVMARFRAEHGADVESMWTDDGFVVRVPESDEPPPTELFIPDPEEIRHLVTMQLGSTSLFAARFRENASRALLLPRRRPGQRTPLWQQRKRSADLLSVAAAYPSFPMLLETYRECLLDIFDLPALEDILTRIRSRSIAVSTVDLDESSPFASSLLFRYVANYIYDGDAPLAERRAQALTIDPAQLRELIGDIDLRELLDSDVLFDYERRLQRLEPRARIESADSLHDLLLHLGDLSIAEIEARSERPVGDVGEELVSHRRAVVIRIGGEERLIPVEYASRYRDALGAPLPAGLPERLLQPTDDPLGDLALRYARTHAPFQADEIAARFGLGKRTAAQTLERLSKDGRLLEGEFTPGRSGPEFCHRDVLGALRHRSLARLRQEVEPVEPEALGRFAVDWHGTRNRRYGLDTLLDAIEQLQGAPLPASVLESEILPARVADYSPSDLDTLAAAGEVVWVGLEPLSSTDGRIALFLSDHFPLLHSPHAEEL
ncbi:MAG: BlaI/MecI/CopY family transcriptional regulator, partial [Acidobacteria bacterium]|nr:BlaI/MecI/CopY family transcriptional regulator [Acidobacteriota bacterium]